MPPPSHRALAGHYSAYGLFRYADVQADAPVFDVFRNQAGDLLKSVISILPLTCHMPVMTGMPAIFSQSGGAPSSRLMPNHRRTLPRAAYSYPDLSIYTGILYNAPYCFAIVFTSF